jgi:hypothetical protein
VLFHLTTDLLAFLTLSCPTRFAFSPHLAGHALTVATTLLNVRIVLALFERSIVTPLFPTEGNRSALGFQFGQPMPTPCLESLNSSCLALKGGRSCRQAPVQATTVGSAHSPIFASIAPQVFCEFTVADRLIARGIANGKTGVTAVAKGLWHSNSALKNMAF